MSRLENAKTRALAQATLRSEYGYDMVALLNSIDDKLAQATSESGRTLVEPLGVPTVARQLTAGVASTNTVLTSSCRRISIMPIGGNIRYSIGSVAQTANATTSHFIKDGERLEFALPATPNLAIIRTGGVDVPVEISELT